MEQENNVKRSSETQSIVKRASEFIFNLFKRSLPEQLVYHNYVHTVEVVDAVKRIGKGSKLDDEQMEIVTLAAWLHDAGYTEVYKGHEEKGVEIATRFLTDNGYPPEKIARVAACILATRMPQRPQSLIEEVMCDADLSHLGRKSFEEKNELLRLELEKFFGRTAGDLEWIAQTIDFMSNNRFHTKFAQVEYNEQRVENMLRLTRVRRRLEEEEADRARRSEEKKRRSDLEAEEVRGKLALQREKIERSAEREKRSAERDKSPERGVETMFRVVAKNHMDLSAMADNKANIMISINALIISIILSTLVHRLDGNSYLTVPTLLILGVCLATIITATIATRPKVTTGTFTNEDIEQRRANLLFFGNFFNMRIEDYEHGMQTMMGDREYLYGSMIRDTYHLGQVLGRKYRFLRISYNIFMYGLIVAVLSFAIAFLFFAPGK